MYHPPSRRVRFWRKVSILTVMAAAVITGVVVLTALTLGYGFDEKEGRIEQGGLMQFNTQPSGATVTVDGTVLSSKTPTKLATQAGDYDIVMQREGYLPWKKTVPIQAGNISWVTYPRLIPEKLKAETVATYSKSVASALPSGSGRRYAVLEAAADPTVTLTRIDNDDVETERIALTEGVATKPEAGQVSRFSIEEWTSDERHVLLKHEYGTNSTQEWILFDLNNPEKSINISTLLGIDEPLQEPIFTENDGSELYALIGDSVRILDLDRETLSRPLVQDVSTYHLYGDGVVLFAQKPVDGTQAVGYVKEDFDEPRIVKHFENSTDISAQFDVGKYFDKYYLLVSHENKATMWSTKDLPKDPDTRLDLSHVQTFELANPITSARITDNGQFATVQDGSSFATYNLELNKLATTKLSQPRDADAQELEHLDRYLYWGMNGDKLRTYEFDGANQHDIMTIDPRFGATLSPAGKYLYAIDKIGDGSYGLNRVKLLEINR